VWVNENLVTSVYLLEDERITSVRSQSDDLCSSKAILVAALGA